MNKKINYNQAWGNRLVDEFRKAWNGGVPSTEFLEFLRPTFVFHYHDRKIEGLDAYRQFIQTAKQATRELDLVPAKIFSYENYILLYFYWTSEQWHKSIVEGGKRSNYGKIVFRVEEGKIVEKWEQAPDFIYLLGKNLSDTVMDYPDVIPETLFIENDDGLYATKDEETVLASRLFEEMNDCFLGRSPLRNMKNIQHEDLIFYNGEKKGKGIQEWKTFAYALHTAFGKDHPVRGESLYVRKENRVTVFSRETFQIKSPSVLLSTNGMVGSLQIEVQKKKIKTLYTCPENYISFLGTDFTCQDERIRSLFQGKRIPIVQKEIKRSLKPPPGISCCKTARGDIDRNLNEQVAIVGLAGKFPSGDSVENFWDALTKNKSGFSEFPEDRPYLRRGTKIRYAGFLEGIDQFDAEFFNISPVLAEYMDPQQRLLMEVIWHSIENSGHGAGDFSGPETGLFVSTLSDDYKKLLQDHHVPINGYYWMGNESAMFPAKIARFLNIQGPCKFINAECASSLVAIHEASKLIKNGEIDQAIVGATNSFFHPYGFAVREESLLSSDQRPYLFSKKSQGQLRGEAIVAVILKSLSKAREDDDEIYGIVAGSAVNNSGKIFSISAAHVEQQADVLTRAWRDASVDPSDISLIECHASGVREGDFAEIAAIKKAFKGRVGGRDSRARCHLTTVKASIGHTEAASGLVALVKLLFQFRYNRIIGIDGLEEVDPELRLDQSHLKFVREQTPWKKEDKRGETQSRVAGINTFATGGYNVHVVIKDYPPKPKMPSRKSSHPVVIVLSAETEESLWTSVDRLHTYLASEPDIDLINLAYTLQVGRDPMTFRIALVVLTVVELMKKMESAIKNRKKRKGVFIGRKEVNQPLELLDTQEGHEYIQKLLSRKKRFKIAELWSQGYPISWTLLDPGEERRRIAGLPLYPFRRTRYGLPESAAETVWAEGSFRGHHWLHPFLHQNTSDLFEQRFSSTFTGEEFFLEDHVVQGRKTLPGAVYLEMARAATEEAVGAAEKGQTEIQLKNIVWARPITVDRHAREVHVRIFPEAEGQIQYEIYTESFSGVPVTSPMTTAGGMIGTMEDEDSVKAEVVVHSQGVATLNSLEKIPLLDLKALKEACNQRHLSSEQCYDAFRAMGINYGPGHQGIEDVYVGEGQVLARLSLPSSVAETHDRFVLHPSLMDAAFQASIGFIFYDQDPQTSAASSSDKSSEDRSANKEKTENRKLRLPFALHSLKIFGPCPSEAWTLIRRSEGSKAEDKVQKLDLDLCDEAGKVCIQIKEFSSRIHESEVGSGQIERLISQSNREEASVSKEDCSSGKEPFEEEARLPGTTESNTLSESIGQGRLEEKAHRYFRKQLSSALKLPLKSIRVEDPLEKYGIDSVMVIELTKQLEKTFGSLSKTLFFEYQTLQEVIGYFLESHSEKLRALLNVEETGRSIAAATSEQAVGKEFSKRETRRTRFASLAKASLDARASKALDIAIIGLSGRYPQARDLQAFWENLRAGKNCITEVPEERWDWREYYSADRNQPGCHYSKWGGFIEDVDKFDPLFFNISPREAETIDPQERLFLEHVWMALEDAGYRRDDLQRETEEYLAGQVGVYAGVMYGEYQLFGAETMRSGQRVSLGNIYAGIANRVSYILNLHGPSMAVDTMCSSSMTAIHLACQDLKLGRTNLGIAGGVNVSVHPNKYLLLSQGQFISSKGHCESFGEGGDGYIPAEGVGVALLKRLGDAERDGDHIYGVIKGSAVNHGGKTNGYTVPNPNAQQMAITRTLKESRIDPRTISYIEAHGTGTELGDPIEIAGLSKAFGLNEEKQFCRIGSVKSNIGHCESAAGIAGVTKVLLQLKYGQIVPSLHSKVLNPNIDFANTPFVVNQELQVWKKPVVDGKAYPRIAGISSFGAGGSNAHVLIEEYVAQSQVSSEKLVVSSEKLVISSEDGSPCTDEVQRSGEVDRSLQTFTSLKSHKSYLIVLSAKNEDRLREYAKKLLIFVTDNCSLITDHFTQTTDNGSLPSTHLGDFAYTLQVGREAMEERLGLIVTSSEELQEKLKGFLEDRDDVENLFQGQVEPNKETLAVFVADEDMAKTIDAWINKGKYEKLLDLWVKGLNFNWRQLYEGTPPGRISLPTYPFARERYWIPVENDELRMTNDKWGVKKLHPLVHENTSDFEEQRFSSTFTGEEFFLADHVVNDQKVLPGIVYLEMARAAIELASGAAREDRTSIHLKNIVWVRPITVTSHAREVHIGLFPEESGDIQYDIYTRDSAEVEEVIHSQGIAAFSTSDKPLPLDLPALREECNRNRLSAEQCYEAYKTMGMDYGPSYHGIEEVYVGEKQVLVKVVLPVSLTDTQEQFVLHPSILDSALQASIGFSFLNQKPGKGNPELLVPFALQSLEIFERCPSISWSLIRAGQAGTGDQVQKFDLDLCDDQGNICLRIKGISFREFKGEAGLDDGRGTLMYKLVWKEKAIPKEAHAAEYAEHLVLLCELGDVSSGKNGTGMNGTKWLTLQSSRKSLAEQFQMYAIQAFEQIQAIFKSKPQGKTLIQIVAPLREDGQFLGGLSGLLKTAHRENPRVLGQLIEVEPKETKDGLIETLRENRRSPQDAHIRYREGRRLVASWEKIPMTQEAMNLSWKEGGVYLIVGGAGGLGLIFARDLAGKTKSATLILTGRSVLSEEKQDALTDIESLGVRIEYRQVDVSKSKAVAGLMQSIEKDFGSLQGIFHCAGVIRDNFILKKTEEEWREVLAPKVSGTLNLDEASKNLTLDFFILFSSTAGCLGNSGQADYAVANAFMDTFAVYRNDLVSSRKRWGQTLSINWPLWQEGGMPVDEVFKTMMEENTGMMAMKTSSGIQALNQALASGQPQVMVVEGNLKRLQAFLAQETLEEELSLPETTESNDLPVSIGGETLEEKALHYFKKLLSSSLKFPSNRIHADEPLEKYGIDSVMVMQLTNQLEKAFGSLSKTLFFEYQTIQEIAGYFVESHEEKLRAILNIEETMVGVNGATSEGGVVENEGSKRRPRRSRFASMARVTLEKRASEVLDIAIIGLSGRYPQARDLQAYWENLREGRDCITEVPQDRWAWQEYYTEDPDQPGGHTSKWGGFIEDVDKFDPLFFNISPLEAEFIDPQERLFLEHVWMALEDAGYCRATLQGGPGDYLSSQVGVYAGVMYGEYQLLGVETRLGGNRRGVAGIQGSIANRVSYVLDLHGPSMTVDTMCSSSLTCLHLACQDLKHGRTDMGIVGGVNVSIHPNKYLALSQGHFISTRGHCGSFGDGGDGYIPGEGVGVALLKRLVEAERDGDHIYGVIKGSAVNHGGKTNGYTVPNPNAQQMAIARALKESRIDPRTISYIEAHGTGTTLGDPIEITGLTKAFAGQAETSPGYGEEKKRNKETGWCWLGSVKSNIGHCESAAGIAGISKVLLQMQHRQIVPSLHSQVLNPNIDFTATPFVVNQELRDWERPVIDGKEVPRIAGISSFGAGGSNAHVVIEEYAAPPQVSSEKLLVSSKQLSGDNEKEIQNPKSKIQNLKSHLIVLSAKNEDRLREYAKKLLIFVTDVSHVETSQRHLRDHCSLITDHSTHLHNLAYTLQVGREAMEARMGLIVNSIKELQEKLKGFLEDRDDIENLYRGQVKCNKETLAVFVADEDMAKTIGAWISKGKYSKLLDLWTKGLIFDWNRLYGESKPRRVSLPTYPFARERYWLETQGVTIESGLSETKKQWLFIKEEWVSASMPDDIDWISCLKEYEGQCIYIVYTDQKDRDASYCLLKELEQAAGVTRGVDVQGFTIAELVKHSFKECPVVILFFGSTREESQMVHADISALFQVSQHVMKEAWEASIRIYYLYESERAQPHLGGEALSGFLKSAMIENSQHSWKCIGNYDEHTATHRSQLLFKEWLLDQIERPRTLFSEVRYEGSERRIPQRIEINLPSESSPVFRSHGVYLMVGGLGPVGELLGHELAHRYQATLVILSRGAWDEKKQEQCRQLEAAGSKVFYYAVDITDQRALEETYAEIKQKVKTINGVIHLARLVEDGLIVSKSWDSFERVIGAKTQGTINLDVVTMGETLDFFILFSSMAAFGIRGASDYGYSAAFQNSFARYRNQLQRQGQRFGKAVSVCWGPWTVDKYQPENRDQNLKGMGLDLIDMEAAFPWINTENFYDISVLGAMAVQQPARVRRMLGLKTQTPEEPSGYRETLDNAVKRADEEMIQQEKSVYAADDVTQVIRKVLIEILKLQEADEHETFQTYGLDSVSGMQVSVRLEKLLQREVKPKWLIDFPTIAALAQHLGGQLDADKKQTLPPREKQESNINEDSSSQNLKREPRLFSILSAPKTSPEPIAVIGLSGYFPQSMSVQAFWDALDADRCLIEEIPKSRFDWEKIYDPLGMNPEKSCTKWGGFIPDIQGFDPKFFKISPAEAKVMDPRQRLLFMSVYHTLEDAGYAPESLKQSQTGVFIGAESNEYIQNVLEGGISLEEIDGPVEGMLANRISYFFDFLGPSEVVNTMCSAAAVALHRAVCSLRSGEIAQAVVGAANLLLRPEPFIALSRSGEMSPENTVNSFGKAAKGYLRAEGVASVFLKPLSQAEVDGDPIYVVIKNTAVNYNGQGGMSMAAPYTPSHMNLIQTCYRQVGIDPQRIGYIEAQGMGNPVGDMAEWDACNRALIALAQEQKKERGLSGTCRISTLKPMTGHMHSASALGALFKIIRSLQTDKIHKILNFKERNSYLAVDGQPCKLAMETDHWSKEKLPRLAGLHSYGSGGNNAHILLEEYPMKSSSFLTPSAEPVVIPLSAQTAAERRTLVQQLMTCVSEHKEYAITSIAHTLQVGRDAMTYRVAFVTRSRDQWIYQAEEYIAGKLPDGVFEGEASSKTILLPHADPIVLAEAWSRGKRIAWEKEETEKKVIRLHLPGYSFAKERYWVSDLPRYNDTVLGQEASDTVEHQVGGLEYIVDRLSEESIDVFLNKFSGLNGKENLICKKGSRQSKNMKLDIPPAEIREAVRYREHIEEIITKAVMDTLQLSRGVVSATKRFETYDMTSIRGTQLIHDLEDIFNTVIPPKWLFEYPCIRELSIAVEDKIQEEKIGG